VCAEPFGLGKERLDFIHGDEHFLQELRAFLGLVAPQLQSPVWQKSPFASKVVQKPDFERAEADRILFESVREAEKNTAGIPAIAATQQAINWCQRNGFVRKVTQSVITRMSARRQQVLLGLLALQPEMPTVSQVPLLPYHRGLELSPCCFAVLPADFD